MKPQILTRNTGFRFSFAGSVTGMVEFTAVLSKLMAALKICTAEYRIMKHSHMQSNETAKCVYNFDVNLSGGSSISEECDFCKF